MLNQDYLDMTLRRPLLVQSHAQVAPRTHAT